MSENEGLKSELHARCEGLVRLLEQIRLDLKQIAGALGLPANATPEQIVEASRTPKERAKP